MQVRLEVVTINNSAYPSFGSGLTNIAKHVFLIFIFIKSRAAITGGRNSNATFAQAVNRCTKPQNDLSFTFKLRDVKCEVPNHPPRIAAHLQGTQKHDVQNHPCKRATIANTRQIFFSSVTENTGRITNKIARRRSLFHTLYS